MNKICSCWSNHIKKHRADGLEEGHRAVEFCTDGVGKVVPWGAALIARVGWRYDRHYIQLGLGKPSIAAEDGNEHSSCGK